MKKGKTGILTISIVVSIIGVLGKFLGFARDAVIAAIYGANWQTDAFFFAQSMPAIIFPAVSSSLSTAFLASFVSKNDETESKADLYGSKAICFCIVFAIGLSILAVVLSPVIVPVFAPGFSINQSTLAIKLTQITMAAFALTMAHYMFGAVLSAKKLFYGAQIAAFVYNLCVICITVILAKDKDIVALTYTVVVGHIIQMIILYYIARKRFQFSVVLRCWDSETKQLIILAIPILLGNSIVQLNNIVDKVISSLFGEGAMSALSYSNTLNRFVMDVVTITLSTVIYPIMAEKYSKKEMKELFRTITSSISIVLIILLPISIITALCSNDIVKSVYERGSFDSDATLLTSYALRYYGPMFIFSAVQAIVVRVFYSMKDTKTPLKAAAIAIASNAIMSYLFSRVLGMGLGGIALGTTISTLLAAILLLVALKKRLPDLNYGLLKNTMGKVVVSALILLIEIVVLKKLMTSFHCIPRFILITIIGFITHFGVLVLLKCEELGKISDYVKVLIKKRRKTGE